LSLGLADQHSSLRPNTQKKSAVEDQVFGEVITLRDPDNVKLELYARRNDERHSPQRRPLINPGVTVH
jgi:hypothetical protein